MSDRKNPLKILPMRVSEETIVYIWEAISSVVCCRNDGYFHFMGRINIFIIKIMAEFLNENLFFNMIVILFIKELAL